MFRRVQLPDRLLLAVPVAIVVFMLAVHTSPAGVGRAIDDLGQLAAAAVAAVACTLAGRRQRRTFPAQARCWLLLAAATGSWAAGEAVWSYYEIIAGRQSPFPSAADVGYLLFPVLAGIALLLWPSAALHGTGRWRALLDGVLVAGALFVISWVTALGAIARAGGDSTLGYVVSLAYPVADLVLLTLAVLVVTHSRQAARSGLELLACGLGALCVADSGFAYLTSLGRYVTGSPVDAGWLGGFLLIAVAATTSTVDNAALPVGPQMESSLKAVLPYLPASLGLAVAVAGQLTGHANNTALIVATAVIAALLGRQLLAVLENRRLVEEVVDTQQQLRHQAFHDPLTGLANRALFTDRLRHGLDLHARDLRPLSLLYCDLDGFKTVNDTLGHDAGDVVLKTAAERLQAITRPGDTVARLGGDEFAIILEDGGDAVTVAARILAAFEQPTFVGTQQVQLATSIGIAELDATCEPVTTAEYLHRADTAMYQAKRNGKSTAIRWTAQLSGGSAAGATAAAISTASA